MPACRYCRLEWSPRHKCGKHPRSEADRLRAENARLRDALRKYGEHRWKCDVTRYIRGSSARVRSGPVECDCGWQEHLTAMAEESKP
jgi:hypothetical protein